MFKLALALFFALSACFKVTGIKAKTLRLNGQPDLKRVFLANAFISAAAHFRLRGFYYSLGFALNN
jgi:hypothetical protein